MAWRLLGWANFSINFPFGGFRRLRAYALVIGKLLVVLTWFHTIKPRTLCASDDGDCTRGEDVGVMTSNQT